MKERKETDRRGDERMQEEEERKASRKGKKTMEGWKKRAFFSVQVYFVVQMIQNVSKMRVTH